jgi:hypothetical protein
MPRRKQPDPAAHPGLPPAPKSVTVVPKISFIEPPATDEAQIPEQRQHFQLPTRFGAVPVDEAPLGWEVETRPREVKVTKFYEERRANHGVMLAWNFSPDARRAAEILAARESKRIDFVRLSLVRLESDEFREHVVSKHPDYGYGPLFSFIQPSEVRVAARRIKPLVYEFDVSESVSLNKDGAIANVQ